MINLEGDLETCEDRLLLASQKLDKAATAADDSDRMRKVLTSRAAQDEERMSKLEEELKGRIRKKTRQIILGFLKRAKRKLKLCVHRQTWSLLDLLLNQTITMKNRHKKPGGGCR